MAVKVYKPTSAGRRGMTGHSFEEITKSTPQRSLTEAIRKHGGRINTGRVTVRHRGGGHKRRYRIIDFKGKCRGLRQRRRRRCAPAECRWRR